MAKKYIVLSPLNTQNNIGGIVIVSDEIGNTKCCVSLFGVGNEKMELLFDDLVTIRQFKIGNASSFEIEKNYNDLSDFVVGVFNSERKLIMIGSTFGIENQEQIERLKIALENKDALKRLGALAKRAIGSFGGGVTFFDSMALTLFELFALGVPDSTIQSIIPNSKWVKIFTHKDVIGVGIVERDGKICAVGLAFPAMSREKPRKEVDENFTFYPISKNMPNGFGYFIVLQDAIDGSVIKSRQKIG